MTLDEDLLRRSMAASQRGDQSAYRLVLDQSRNWLTRYFARRIAPELIDDLVQDTLLSVHAKRATFDSTRPYLPWLAAIARYRWIDALRRTCVFDELDDDCASIVSTEDEVLARLSLARLMNCLTPAQSNAITLTRIEGKSVAETATICGQSEGAVKVNVHRGLRKLASLIESE